MTSPVGKPVEDCPGALTCLLPPGPGCHKGSTGEVRSHVHVSNTPSSPPSSRKLRGWGGAYAEGAG
eukprot:11431218-Alexandrium_andersonii.AAC.1